MYCNYDILTISNINNNHCIKFILNIIYIYGIINCNNQNFNDTVHFAIQNQNFSIVDSIYIQYLKKSLQLIKLLK